MLRLSQEGYIEKVLKRFNMKDVKLVTRPLAKHFKLTKKLSPKIDKEKEYMTKVTYALIVGSLMYAMVCTRPDIAQAMGVISRFMNNLGKDHWEEVKWILRYLRGNSHYSLCFGGSNSYLQGYVDSDMASDLDGGRSTIGYVFTIGGTILSCIFKLQ